MSFVQLLARRGSYAIRSPLSAAGTYYYFCGRVAFCACSKYGNGLLLTPLAGGFQTRVHARAFWAFHPLGNKAQSSTSDASKKKAEKPAEVVAGTPYSQLTVGVPKEVRCRLYKRANSCTRTRFT